MCQQEGKEFVKKPIYENVFNIKFNIGFHKPKKDQCSVCEAYKNDPQKQDFLKKNKQENHLKNARQSILDKEKDKKNVRKI